MVANPQTVPDIMMVSRESVIVKLTLLIGACRVKSITKKHIERSLQDYITELDHEQ